ncbi:MAG: peptidase T [Longicatena sp.]
MNVQERFLKYVTFDTQSDENSSTTPSTLKQLELGKFLVNELHQLGIENAHLDEYGIVYASVSANTQGLPKIGFIAHMDTSPDMLGKDVKARIIENYDGNDIVLNKELKISMGPQEFSNLSTKKGKRLIVTDGTTLLGADDKAGIAEIMTMLERLLKEDKAHGDIRIAFTPDEEVGRGTEHFDIKKFDADFAYTVDGGSVDCVDYECFNAASAHVEIQGNSIHPGDAKDKMINASLVAMEFHSMLPVQQNPAYTQGYEGFHHLCDMQGECEHASLSYIIRNHDEQLFEQQKKTFLDVAQFLNKKYPANTIRIKLEDSYANMRTIIEKDMRIVDLVKTSMKQLGIEPCSQAIRGGTDGARLTFEGLPCPNLGTGGYNYHGKYEYACIDEMEQSVELLLKIIENASTYQ